MRRVCIMNFGEECNCTETGNCSVCIDAYIDAMREMGKEVF